MKRKPKIQVKQVNDSLHINLRGKISPHVCAQFILVMGRMYRGYGKIFVNTSRVTDVEPKSKETIEKLIRLLDLPENKIFYSGKSAPAICHGKNRQGRGGGVQISVDSLLHRTDFHGEGILGDLDFLWDEQPERLFSPA